MNACTLCRNWSIAAIRMFRRTVEWFCCQNKYYVFVEMVEWNGIDLFRAHTIHETYTLQNVSAFYTRQGANTNKAISGHSADITAFNVAFFVYSHHACMTLSIQIECTATFKSNDNNKNKACTSPQTQKEEQLQFFFFSHVMFLSSCWNHYYRWLIFGIKSIKNQFLHKMRREKKASQRHCGWLLLRHDK